LSIAAKSYPKGFDRVNHLCLRAGIDSGYFSKPARKLPGANRSIDHFILDPGKLNGFHLSNASWVELQREARERTQIFAPTE